MSGRPSFYSLINEQCNLVAKAGVLFVEYMEKNDANKGEEVCAIEHQADELKSRNLAQLNSTFATPMDREDIYRAIVTVDMVANYLKTTVREMQVLKVEPDQYTLEMAVMLRDGAETLRQGYAKIETEPRMAEPDAQFVARCERNIEKTYRRGIAHLFMADQNMKEFMANAQDAEVRAMQKVLDVFRRREVYRHLSNAGDELAKAGATLHDIVIQIS